MTPWSQPSRLQDCEIMNYLSKTSEQKQLEQKELQQKCPFPNILTEYFDFKREKMIEGRRGCLLLHGINLILFFFPPPSSICRPNSNWLNSQFIRFLCILIHGVSCWITLEVLFLYLYSWPTPWTAKYTMWSTQKCVSRVDTSRNDSNKASDR